MKEKLNSEYERGQNMEQIPQVIWEFDHGEPDIRFGGMAPGPGWRAFGFPAATKDAPFVTSNFIADKRGLVVGENIRVEHIVGRESFPEGEPLTPDVGSNIDYRMLHNLRAYADAVMWGRNTLTREPSIIPDLMNDRRLIEFRKKNRLPLLPKLVLVSNSAGNIDFALPAFHTQGLETIILTNQKSAEALAAKAREAMASAKIVGLGQDTLDVQEGLKHLRQKEDVEVLLVEGGHSLIESLHGQGLLHEAFVTTSDKALDPEKVKGAKYMFDFRAEGARHMAHGNGGQFQFDRWRWE